MDCKPQLLMDNKHILYVLRDAKPKLRKILLQNVNDSVIQAINEIALNTLKGNIELTPEQKIQLKKYKNELRFLRCSKRKVASKRKLLVQKGGFLPILIGTVLSGIIGQLIENVK